MVKKSKELKCFLGYMVQAHVKTTTVKNDEKGEGMMSNIYQGYVVEIGNDFLFMGNYEDKDNYEITAAIEINDISAITVVDEDNELLQQMPKEDDEVH